MIRFFVLPIVMASYMIGGSPIDVNGSVSPLKVEILPPHNDMKQEVLFQKEKAKKENHLLNQWHSYETPLPSDSSLQKGRK